MCNQTLFQGLVLGVLSLERACTGPMLGYRLRRWAHIEPIMGRCIVVSK